jgi:hypothetical protein
MDHSYEELRDVALDILAGRERGSFGSDQYQHLKIGIAEVLESRSRNQRVFNAKLSSHDSELFLELFWDLFRQGIITLGLNDDNREFPFFRVSSFGKKLIEGQNPYFFHDVSSYEKVILSSVPQADTITLIYLKEAMQAFMSGCLLSCSVMLGVATEHSFLKLLDAIEANATYNSLFKNAFSQKTILQKLNKFKNVLDQNLSILSSDAKEDLDTNFSGIISMIRTFRNESGHPSGRIISREQCYILLQLFIPCCKKIYQLIDALK